MSKFSLSTPSNPKRMLSVVVSLTMVAALFVSFPLSGSAEEPELSSTSVAYPEGRIVFDSTRAGNRDVFAMNADGSGVTNLTDGELAGDVEPAFSTLAQSIAFASCRVDGENAVEDLQCDLLESIDPRLSASELYLMRPDGGNQTALTVDEGTALPAANSQPDFSPDGSQIVFTSFREGEFDIYKMNATPQAQQTRLTESPTPALITPEDRDPAWSPDGGKIAFVSNRGVDFDIFVMNPDGSDETALTAADANPESNPSWSPDGTKIAIERAGNIFVLTLNAGRNLVTATSQVTSLPGTEKEPVWSPDGKWIAFAGNQQGNFDIYLVDADPDTPDDCSESEAGVQTLCRLTTSLADDDSPDWADNFELTVNGGASANVLASPQFLPAAHYPLQANTNGGDLQQAPLPVGLAPLPVGLAPLPVGLAPLPVGLAPLPVGLAPLPVGLAPLNVGLGPLPVGLAPLPVGLAPLNVGLAPLPVGLAYTSPLSQDAQAALDNVLLSSLPLRAPHSWENIVSGSSLEGKPIHSVSLKDVHDVILDTGVDKAVRDGISSKLNALDVGDIDFSISPLGRLNAISIALGGTALTNIRVPTRAIDANSSTDNLALAADSESDKYWCQKVDGINSTNCASLSLSLLELELSGKSIENVPVQAFPLKGIALESDALVAPLLKARPRGMYLGGSFGAIKIADIESSRRDTIVDCGVVNCSSPENTKLFEVWGEIRDTARVQNLGSNTAAPLNTLTVGEVVYAMIDPESNPALEMAPLQNLWGYPGAGSSLTTYNVRYAPAASSIDKVVLELPPHFYYIPSPGVPDIQVVSAEGTSTIDVEPDISGTDEAMTLTWPLDDSVSPGAVIIVTASVRHGLNLRGPLTSSARVLAGTTLVDERADRVPVTVGETFEPNDDPNGSVTTIEDGTVYLSHVSKLGDKDYYRLPAPAAGRLVEIFLGHIPPGVDLDLVVYGPKDAVTESPLRTADPAALPGAVMPVPDEGYPAVDESTPPQTLNDIPIESGIGPVVGISATRPSLGDIPDESVRVFSPHVPAGDPGNYFTIQVSGYNGSSSTLPYTLRARVREVFDLPGTCVSYRESAGAPSNGWTEVAQPAILPTTKSLVLVNRDRMFDFWGSEAQTVLTKIDALIANDKVAGAVVYVDASQEVRNSYDAWDADACSPEKANDVVRAINAHVDQIAGAAHELTNLVVVGPDSIIPFSRLPDRTQQGNERAYAGDLAFTGKNPTSAAFSRSFLLSDNPFGDLGAPIPWFGGYLYVPDLGVGRLVETPGQIAAQIDLFLDPTVDGKLDPKTSLSVGADFMKDLSTAIDQRLEALLGGAQEDLINDTWTKTDLRTKFTFSPEDLIALNAHSDHYQLAPPGATNASGIFNTTDDLLPAAGSLPGLTERIIWSMGCHTGLNLVNALSGDTKKRLDWAEAAAIEQAAVYVGQTGYGLGSNSTIALSEALMELFTTRMAQFAGSPSNERSVGRALAQAKKDYVAQAGAYGVFDEKALHEATFFGLPMFQDPAPQAVPPETSGTPVVTSDHSDMLPEWGDWSVTPKFTTAKPGLHGSYFQVIDTNTGQEVHACAVHYRPIEPCAAKIDVTQQGARAWAIVTDASSRDVANFNPEIMNPLAASHVNGIQEPPFDGTYPSAPIQVTAGSDQQFLVAQVGAFRGDENTGTQRLFTSMQGKVFKLNSFGKLPPQIQTFSSGASADLSTARFRVTVDEDDVEEVIDGWILYLDNRGGDWKLAELSETSAGVWESEEVLLAGDGLESIVQMLGEGGVAFSTGKGLAFVDGAIPAPAPYDFCGPRPPDTNVKNGSTVPVKWTLYVGGTKPNCDASGGTLITDTKTIVGIDSYLTSSSATFANPSSWVFAGDFKPENVANVVFGNGQFKYEWKLLASNAGTKRVFEIHFDDFTTHRILYTIR